MMIIGVAWHFASLKSLPRHDVRTEHLDDGRTVYSAFLIDADGETMLDGAYSSYWESGTPDECGFYVHGKRNGVWRRWHVNGTLIREEEFRDGRLSGWARSWSSDGRIVVEQLFVDGKRHGPGVRRLTKSGKLLGAWGYSHDEAEGLLIEWYENGERARQQLLINGNTEGQALAWFESGKLKSDISYIAGVPNGTWREWDQNGKVVRDARYVDGVEQK